jgi:hypothetical protein
MRCKMKSVHGFWGFYLGFQNVIEKMWGRFVDDVDIGLLTRLWIIFVA